MFFLLKNPLKRKLSALALHRKKEQCQGQGAFLGASLLNKKPLTLALDSPFIIRITGGTDTYAPDSAIRLIRQAIEQHQSVLLADFQQGEEFWHRFWAVSFYLDRAKDFRLIDLSHPERSDLLGAYIPKNVPNIPSHLAQDKKPADIKKHLLDKGLVALTAHPEKEQNKKNYLEILWEFTKHWQEFADFLVIFGWETLSSDQQNFILSQRSKSVSPHLVLFQNQFSNTSIEQNFLKGVEEIMFRQRNSLPDFIMDALKNKTGRGSMNKILNQINSRLEQLDDPQCLVVKQNHVDLVQTNTGDGLPWPPEYRPLRSRFE